MADFTYKPGSKLPSGRLDFAKRGGVCVVEGCEKPAYSGRAWYCAKHNDERESGQKAKRAKKQATAKRTKVEQVESITEGTPPPPPKPPRGDEKHLREWLGMMLVMVTYVIGMKASGGRGLLMRGADKELAMQLAMTDDQADNVAAVFSKKIAPTKFYRSAGHQVVDVLDMETIAAVEAVWEWGTGIAPYLRRNPPGTIHHMNNGRAPHAPEQQTAASPFGGQGGIAIPAHRLDN